MSARIARRGVLAGLAACGGLAAAGVLSGAVAGDDLTAAPARFPSVFGTRLEPAGRLPGALPRARVLKSDLDEVTLERLTSWVRQGALGTPDAAPIATTARVVSARRLLAAVNDYANRMPYIEDRANYGLADYWADTRAFFVAGGDCEDFAIAKFKLLRRLGVARERMRIVMVVDRARMAQHAVLAVAYAGEALVLDSLIRPVIPEHAITTYVPTLSVSQAWLYRHVGAA